MANSDDMISDAERREWRLQRKKDAAAYIKYLVDERMRPACSVTYHAYQDIDRDREKCMRLVAHAAEKKYRCEQCARRFGLKCSLKRHVRDYHTPIKDKRRRYICPCCMRRFMNQRSYSRHIERHRQQQIREYKEKLPRTEAIEQRKD
jgi:hypothetical protein